MADRNYPLPRREEDGRFTRGFCYEVSDAMQHAGYPTLTADDMVELQLALFRFIYSPKEG
jgi:hypothetical protein